MKIDSTIKTKDIVLEKIKIALSQRVSNHLLGARTDVFIDELSDLIGIHVHGYIYGEHSKTKSIKYPRNWIEAFKERWFSKWMLKKWPVAYRIHEISVTAMYPKFRVQMPQEQHILRIHMRENSICGDNE